MSSFYDDASLVVIPSGYKTSKVYAEKPTDGSGDLAFTRTGDTATRVNSAGIIERVRTNLNTFSEQWDNAAYTSFRQNITANAGVAPNGTTTADKLIPTNVSGSHITLNSGNINSNGEYSISCYVKASGLNKVAIRESKSVGYYASFDLSNGTLLDSSAGQSNTITNVGNGWYRISSTRSYVGVISLGIVPLPDSYTTGDPMVSYVGNNVNGVLVWGGQTEFGTVTDYIPTTTAAVSVGPVANVPRLDYLGSTCPRLLLEPQRTNLLQFSEQIDNAYWTKQDASITANTSVSPDGYTNADSLIENSATAQHLAMRTGITITNATAYTASVYFKANTRTRAAIQLAGAGFFDTANGLVIFNLSTGTIVSQSGNATGTITAMGNGWYRCTATKTSVGTSGVVAFNLVDSSNNISYAGNGTSGVFLWGAQLEAGAYATSYIPTLAASVTRGADSSSSANISSLFGATEGSFYVQLTHDGRNTNNAIPVFLRSSINGNFNRATYLQFGATNLTLNVYDAGTLQAAISGGTYTNGQTLKVAFAYKANDFVLYVNGVQIGTDTSGAISSSLSFIDFGSYMLAQSTFQYDGKVSQALLFKTRLTNAQLAELTTL